MALNKQDKERYIKLKAFCVTNEIVQSKLAKDAGIVRQSMNQYLKGKTRIKKAEKFFQENSGIIPKELLPVFDSKKEPVS